MYSVYFRSINTRMSCQKDALHERLWKEQRNLSDAFATKLQAFQESIGSVAW